MRFADCGMNSPSSRENDPEQDQFRGMDYSISCACWRRNDFQKADRQGENPFAVPPLGFSSLFSMFFLTASLTMAWMNQTTRPAPYAVPSPTPREVASTPLRGHQSCAASPNTEHNCLQPSPTPSHKVSSLDVAHLSNPSLHKSREKREIQYLSPRN